VRVCPRRAVWAVWAKLAKRAECVIESVLEMNEMSRTYAFWFYFFGFSQPLAEELS